MAKKDNLTVSSLPVTKIPLLDRALLLGPPGVGKTEILIQKTKEEAARRGKIFADLRTANVDQIISSPEKYFVFLRIIAPHIFPEDLSYPSPRGEGYTEPLPPKAFKVLSLPDIEGVLFIDELNNVQRDDQMSMYYSLILEKEAGWLKLSDNIIIVAAGNTTEWSDLARALPWPLLNRLTVFYVSPPSVQEWGAYMEKNYERWEKTVLAYLHIFPNDLLSPPQVGAENVNFPTPRSWTRLATLLPQHPQLYRELAVGLLGPTVGEKFAAFLEVSKRIDVQRILNELKKNNYTVFSELKPGEKFTILNVLSERFKEYNDFLKWLAENDREYFILFLILLQREKRVEFVTMNPQLIEKVARELKDFIA